MKIGLIAPPWVAVPPTAYGGTEVIVDRLARGFAAAGHDVALHATGDSTCPVLTSWTYEREQMARLGSSVVELRHLIDAYEAVRRCDVVHDHTVLGPVYSLRYPNLPVVTTNHGAFDAELRSVYRAIADRVALIAISHAQRADAPEIPVARVIYHGIDVDSVMLGDGGGGYLVWLGRMGPEKGAHRAIKVARRAGLPLVMAGKSREPGERRYFAEAVEPRLGPGITWMGEVGGEQKFELLGRAVALLNPIRWPEPFGLVMIEALATGTPVLSFSEGAAPEIVDHGRTGFLCRDETEMAAAVLRVPSLDRAACRASVRRRFSLQRMIREHVSLYEEVLSASNSRVLARPA